MPQAHLTQRFIFSSTPDLLRRIDAWRRLQPDIPSRAEAVRRLLERSLAELTFPAKDKT
jgi:hypothetical protein